MITRFKKSHSKQVSLLHAAVLKGDFLPTLGHKFLSVIYNEASQSNNNFGFVYLIDSKVVGFIFGTKNSSKLFGNIIRKRWLSLLGTAIPTILINPLLLVKIFETLGYNNKFRLNNTPAELIFLGVHSDFRGKSIGKLLVKSLIDKFAQEGIYSFKITVNHSNVIANNFYKKLGFICQMKVKLYNKTMNCYVYNTFKSNSFAHPTFQK